MRASPIPWNRPEHRHRSQPIVTTVEQGQATESEKRFFWHRFTASGRLDRALLIQLGLPAVD